MSKGCWIAVGGMVWLVATAWGQNPGGNEDREQAALPRLGDQLTGDQIRAFADLALKGIDQEFPNKPSHVVTGEHSVRRPQELHPAFYGCFDWHSSVHGHWMLVRLLRLYPDHPRAAVMRDALQRHLSPDSLAAEAAYFKEKSNRSFERMYGWAWALRLVAELHEWDDPQGRQWREHLRPLEETLVSRVEDYLPKLDYPIRTGVHPDTGFALGQILDYAGVVGNESLAKLIEARIDDYYRGDRGYPARFEPSGEDFFSSSLNEADLMRRVLPPDELADWLTQFMPDLTEADHPLMHPVDVSDVTDGKIVHLAGLDLSRGWCLQALAESLPDGDPRREILARSAAAHAEKGFAYVFSGHYEGEHWLATFAVYLLTRVGLPE